MWTRFMDMHSGGGQKLDWGYIYIEANEEEAKNIFHNRFGREPDHVTCSCCGEDYSVSSGYETLEQATAYERHAICAYNRKNRREWKYFESLDEVPEGWKRERHYYNNKVIPLHEYVTDKNILVIRTEEIENHEYTNNRSGTYDNDDWW